MRNPRRTGHEHSDDVGSFIGGDTPPKDTELAIVGAGPAGLAAAVQASCLGVHSTLLGEGAEPGGQLLKQTHKFFGMREHYASVRGIDICRRMVDAVDTRYVQIHLGTVVQGLWAQRTLGISTDDGFSTLTAQGIILATGAIENAIAFPGWTLPGVMGAGALQTMINQWRVSPGKRCLMVGSGNVGLIVAYQLLQAGLKVAAVLEAAPGVGGYTVHADKLVRYGVPIITSSTIKEVVGMDRVEGATACKLDVQGNPIPGSETEFTVDLVCLAVGLRPLSELAIIAGCEHEYHAALGGFVPIHDQAMETTVSHLFVAGDAAGVEEASVAIEEGRLAALGAVASLRSNTTVDIPSLRRQTQRRLSALRGGPMGQASRKAKEHLWHSARRRRPRLRDHR